MDQYAVRRYLVLLIQAELDEPPSCLNVSFFRAPDLMNLLRSCVVSNCGNACVIGFEGHVMASVSRSIPTSRTTCLKNIIVSYSRDLAMNPVATARVDLCFCSCVASFVLLLAGLLLFSSATIRASIAVNLAFPSLFIFVGWVWRIFAITSWDCFVITSICSSVLFNAVSRSFRIGSTMSEILLSLGSLLGSDALLFGCHSSTESIVMFASSVSVLTHLWMIS